MSLVGLGEWCFCQSSAFKANVSFISKLRVTGGFSAAFLSLVPVWVIAVLQVELFIDLHPFQLFRRILQWPAHRLQFLSPWGLNQGRYMCGCSMQTSDPHGAMALQMLNLPQSCVFKSRLLRACTYCTWDTKTPCCVHKLHVLRVDCFSSETTKTTILRPRKALCVPLQKVPWARK